MSPMQALCLVFASCNPLFCFIKKINRVLPDSLTILIKKIFFFVFMLIHVKKKKHVI